MSLHGESATPARAALLDALLKALAVHLTRAGLSVPPGACVLFGPRGRVLPLDPDARVFDGNALAVVLRGSLADRLARLRRADDARKIRDGMRPPPAAMGATAVLLAAELGGVIAVQWWDPGVLLPFAARLPATGAEAVVPDGAWADPEELVLRTSDGLRGISTGRPAAAVEVRWSPRARAGDAYVELAALQTVVRGGSWASQDMVRREARAFLTEVRAFEPGDLLIERDGALVRVNAAPRDTAP